MNTYVKFVGQNKNSGRENAAPVGRCSFRRYRGLGRSGLWRAEDKRSVATRLAQGWDRSLPVCFFFSFLPLRSCRIFLIVHFQNLEIFFKFFQIFVIFFIFFYLIYFFSLFFLNILFI